MKKLLQRLLILVTVSICWIAMYQVWLTTNADATCGDGTRNEWLSQCDCDQWYYRPWEWFQCEFDDPGFTYYGVDLYTDPSTWWVVQWAERYEEGQEATISAIPNTWYVFSGWRWNGNSSRVLDNPYIFEVWGDEEFTAYFTYIGGEPIDRAAIYGAVYTALDSSGIYSNLNGVINDNVTNFPWLYFSSAGNFGDITFQTGLDLTDASIQSFLQTLPDNLSITNGYVNFTPTGNGSWLNVPAKIFFALGNNLPPFIGTGNASDYIIAKDSNDNILSGVNLDGLFANNGILECDRGEWYYCEFYVNHFASFELSGTAFNCANVTDIPVAECEALVDIYNSTDGENWTNTQFNDGRWFSSYSACDWFGVKCQSEMLLSLGFNSTQWYDYVAQLDINNNGLSWSVDVSWLTWLSRLTLPNNNLHSINLSGLTELTYLDLAASNISSINLNGLSSLASLYVYYNELSTIDLAWLSSLETLDVKGNNFSSLDLDGLVTLSYVNVNHNKLNNISLSGLTNVVSVDLSYNRLQTLPDNLYALTGTDMYLDGNLTIQNNCIDRESLTTGEQEFLTIATNDTDGMWDQNMCPLADFSCETIADISTGECNALVDLYNATDGDNRENNTNWLNSNNACTWHDVDCRGWSTVRWLTLSNNYLSGAIPESFSNLIYLNRVNLQYNNITSIPESIGNLSGINVLVLDHNNLTSIPASINWLVNLGQLSIQNNQIGSLPNSIGDLHNLRRFLFNDNYITNLPDTLTQENIPSMDASYFSMYNNCIWTWRVATGVLSFVNDTLEADRWDQFHCAMEYIIASEYSNMINNPFLSWFLDSVFIYDYLPTWVSFTTGNDESLLPIYGTGFDMEFDMENEFFSWDFLWVPTYNARLDVIYGNWDGVLRAPRASTLTPVLGEQWLPVAEDSTWTRKLIAVKEVWASGATLTYTGSETFFGEPIFIRATQLSEYLYSWEIFNQNSQFVIYRSETWASWELNTPIPFCLDFVGGLCLFLSDRFSYYSIVQETLNRSQVYWPIRSGLIDQGIDSNFNEVNNENISGFSNLYFEIAWVGRIEFQEPVDLSNSEVQNFLINMYQNISSYLNMTWWLIAFSPDRHRGTGEWLNIPAQVTMYFETYPFDQEITASDRQAIAPYVTVKNSDGETISGDMLSNLSCYNESLHPKSKGRMLLQSIGTLGMRRSYCEFTTDHFTSFELNYPNENQGYPIITSYPWWWQQDNCPNGDTSPSYYDGKCSVTESKNGTPKKLWDLEWSPFPTEINNAYLYAYNLGITSSPTILGADIEGQLIRSHMAKMMVNYAVKVMGRKPDTTKTCSFGDIANQTPEIQEYIKLACQLGLMWIDMTDFDPNGIVTRAQFGTILSRTLFGDKYNGATPYYEAHLAALQEAGIMTSIANAEIVNEIRWYVMLMLMRADK